MIPIPPTIRGRAMSTGEKAFYDTRSAFVIYPGHPKTRDHASRAEVKRRNTTGLPPKRLLHIQCARAESK